jgi:Spy/CpxP family protein refolding chaperone
MLFGIVAGTLGGLALAGLIHRARRGGCSRHGYGRRGGLFRLVRTLDLDRRQRGEIEDLYFELRPSIDAMRASRRHLTDAALAVLADEAFDRGRVDDVLQKEGQKLSALKERVVASLGKLHGLLTEEQREKLRQYLGVDGAPVAEGPYR